MSENVFYYQVTDLLIYLRIYQHCNMLYVVSAHTHTHTQRLTHTHTHTQSLTHTHTHTPTNTHRG